VRTAGIALGDPQGRMVYSPDNPLADKNGYVRMPDIDLGSQMSQLIMAQRGFQAQTAVLKNAQDVYSSALSIGKSS
jgi:flagellar basal-body rod protein FlgC